MNKRFFLLDYDEIYYIFDNEDIPADKIIDGGEWDDFQYGMDDEQVVERLNELNEKVLELETLNEIHKGYINQTRIILENLLNHIKDKGLMTLDELIEIGVNNLGENND